VPAHGITFPLLSQHVVCPVAGKWQAGGAVVVVVVEEVEVVVVVVVVVVSEHANDPQVNAQLMSLTSHCAILRASPMSQAPSPFTSQASG